jgi:hypothetical protein
MTDQIYKYMLDNTFDLPVETPPTRQTQPARQYVNLLQRGLPKERIDEQRTAPPQASAGQRDGQDLLYYGCR